jgi:hypothetical protein
MKTRLHGTEGELRQTTWKAARNRRSTPGQGRRNRSGFRDLSWRPATAADPTVGCRAGPAAEPVHRRTHEPEHSPLPDREANP